MKTARAPRARKAPTPAMPRELTKPLAALTTEYDLSELEALNAIADRAAIATPHNKACAVVPLDELARHQLMAIDVWAAHFRVKEARAAGTTPDIVDLLVTELGATPIRTLMAAPVTEADSGIEASGFTVPHWLVALATDFKAVNKMTLADAAAWYARNGIPVFPRVAGTKKPLLKGGHHCATTDPEQVAAWWREYPNANIGVATGTAYAVLDADYHPEKGEDGLAELAFIRDLGLLEGAVGYCVSPSGGQHHLFAPDDCGVVGVAQGGNYGFNLDLLSHKAAQAVPPSVNAAGQPYQWVEVTTEGYGPVIEWDTIVKVLRTTPEKAAVQTRGPVRSNGTTNIDGLRKWFRGLTDGRRAAVYRLARQLLDEGHNPDVLIDDIEHIYKGNADKQKEAIRQIDSARKQHAAEQEGK